MEEADSREAYLARKRAKQEAKERSRRQRKLTGVLKTAGLVVLVLVAVGGLVYFLGSQGPETEDKSAAFPIQGRQHIDPGAPHAPYNSNPPSSGWHYAQPARVGFYEEPIADEVVVHNLEHGDVWIAYRPLVSAETKDKLRELAGSKVIVTPREANDADIALVAWGRVDEFSEGEYDERRISDFIIRWRNQGPERVL